MQSASFIRKIRQPATRRSAATVSPVARLVTQIELLSTKSNVDLTYINQIECGVPVRPTITVLCRLSRALRVAPSVLVQGWSSGLGETHVPVADAASVVKRLLQQEHPGPSTAAGRAEQRLPARQRERHFGAGRPEPPYLAEQVG